jgi:hypothetical protein
MNQEFSCSDKETLIAYIYGEGEVEDRALVESHLASCASCAGEVVGLGGVRHALAEWTAPAPASSFRIVRDDAVVSGQLIRPARWWSRPLPGWARAAAAVLLLAGGAALANLDVRYGPDGLSIRTGWQHAAPAPQAAASAPAAPWRPELAALERQLRGDFGAQIQAVRAAEPKSALPAPGAGGPWEARVRTMIDQSVGESERRWQRELADRVVQVQGEFGLQRRSDQVRMLQALGQLQGQTGAEIAQQRQYINYLLNTVSLKK